MCEFQLCSRELKWCMSVDTYVELQTLWHDDLVGADEFEHLPDLYGI